jgi:glucosamine-6-phosphate deaminase
MGLGTIMRARKIVLLASGRDKAGIIYKMSQPLVDTDIPASVLQLHTDVVVIVDREAASLMN